MKDLILDFLFIACLCLNYQGGENGEVQEDINNRDSLYIVDSVGSISNFLEKDKFDL